MLGEIQVASGGAEDVSVDAFRADMETSSGTILKQDENNPDKYSNEQIHEMSWDDIHDMADQHREVKEMY